VSHTVINSRFAHNTATGVGANPAKPGTAGGGSGAAIYSDGNTFTLRLCGVEITDNTANEGGGAIFFVSNDRSGHLVIDRSTLRRNPSRGFETDGLPGIFVLARDTMVTDSVIE
jgi:predicted outer membrane repeat protein